MKSQFHLKCVVGLLAIPLIIVVMAGCSSAGTSVESSTSMVSINNLPEEVNSAPVTVRSAYQFAVANPEVLKQIPCYCGCGAMGHTSNYACYVSGVDESGTVTYDSHALACSICVDITQDTMRLLDDGMTVPDIKAYIDQTYSQYGPSNIP